VFNSTVDRFIADWKELDAKDKPFTMRPVADPVVWRMSRPE